MLRFLHQRRDSVMIGALTVDGGPLHLVLQAGRYNTISVY